VSARALRNNTPPGGIGLDRAVYAELEALVERYGLDAAATSTMTTTAARLSSLVLLIAEDEHAPTTVRDPRAILRDHLADSLVGLDLVEVRDATRIADLGAGAGFPGLPLAIALPGADVALVESNSRKVAFIARAINRAVVTNAHAVDARAEAWPEGIGRHDLVTARALAPLAVVAEYAAPLLAIGGTLVAWRGRRDPEAELVAVRACGRLGLEVGEVRAVRPYAGAENRHLHLLYKVAELPPGFPRRPGMARKRPLAGP
jgi:16S rRNA (guanine527-N7)-methyltransferase